MENETAVISEHTATLQALAVLKAKQENAAACENLDVELATLQVESAGLEAQSQSLMERLTAAERMTRFENDRLVVLGKRSTPEYAQLGQLVADLTAQSLEIEQRKREIVQRCEAIESEKSAALRRSAEEFRDSAVTLIRAAENSLAVILDQTRATLNTLETRLGTPVYRVEDITAGERSETWQTLHVLYGGRTR